MSCVLSDFAAVLFTKENVAIKALSDQICRLAPPTGHSFERLLGRIAEGKGEVYTPASMFFVMIKIESYWSKMDPHCDWWFRHC